MENRCQVALLTLSDGATTYARWQNDYRQIEWDGLSSGTTGGEQATITLPALPSTRAMVQRALAGVWLATVAVYSFPDDGTNDTGPPAAMDLLASTIAEVVAASATLETMTITLGSALAPLGAQFPPRTATTALIGVPCRL